MTPRAYAAGLLAAARRGGGRVVALPDGGAVVAGRRGHDRSVVIPGDEGHVNRTDEAFTSLYGVRR